MTLQMSDLIVHQARLAIQENLPASLEQIDVAFGDGLEIPLPRPALHPDGDYWEQAVTEEDVTQYPAISVDATGEVPRNIDSGTLSFGTALEVIVWVEERQGRTDRTTRRVRRMCAAIVDILTYRANQLQTIDTPAGVATDCQWRGTQFSGRPGARIGTLAFLVEAHQQP